MASVTPSIQGWWDIFLQAASFYPAVVRHGGGYWSEMIGNASGQAADVLETMLRMGRRPDRSQEALAELMERSRQYLVSSGSTFERILLDFNQAIIGLSRLAPGGAVPPGPAADAVPDDVLGGVFQQLADAAASEALKLRSGGGRPDVEAIRSRLESCLSDLRRLEGHAATSRPTTTA